MHTKNKYTETDLLITKITAWIAGGLFFVLMIWGVISLIEMYNYEETNDAQVEEYINPVSSRVSGFITAIRYEENQDVQKGDTLLIIDRNEYVLEQDESEAALLNAEAQIRVLESNIETGERMSQASKSQIDAAKARLIRTQQDYDRYAKLFAVESATQQQLENSRAALDVALAEYHLANENHHASVSKVNDVSSQKGVFAAEIKRRKALLARKKLDVGYTVIRAPYNGKMGRRTIQQGQQIQAGQTLGYIVDKDAGKWVIANFKETQISHMRIGGTAIVTADAFPGKKFNGKIVSLSPATGARFSLLPPDNSTGNFVKIVQRIPVKIMLSGSPEELELLRAGMNTNISVEKE